MSPGAASLGGGNCLARKHSTVLMPGRSVACIQAHKPAEHHLACALTRARVFGDARRRHLQHGRHEGRVLGWRGCREQEQPMSDREMRRHTPPLYCLITAPQPPLPLDSAPSSPEGAIVAPSPEDHLAAHRKEPSPEAAPERQRPRLGRRPSLLRPAALRRQRRQTSSEPWGSGACCPR